MDAGGLAQMSHPTFGNGLPSSGGLASRRGGSNLKPLSFDTIKTNEIDNGAPTPRTSRSHLLAGLRTAPKSATAATFPSLASPTSTGPATQMRNRNSVHMGYGQSDAYNGPKTSMPRFNQQQQQQQSFGGMMGQSHFTPEQILAPPEIPVEEAAQEQMDPNMYAQLVATNMYLAQQKQRLQQQLLSVQAAQQQFQTLNLNNNPAVQNQYQAMYQQQQLQQLQALQNLQLQQQMVAASMPATQGNVYAVVDPMTGQQSYYVDQSGQLSAQADQYGAFQQQPAAAGAPRVQVSPPPVESHPASFRNNSPPRRFGSPNDQHTPLPPPSANAFRRGHKKSSSLVGANNTLSVATNEVPKSAGPKTANFPLTPAAIGTYMPGQGRAGEHPVRQPRGPPSFDELKKCPTSKGEGSKNFVTRTRRSAIHNLTRAGISRRQVAATGSSGSISPISESAEEIATPLTDDESDSGRSGSGSLNGEDVGASLPSSRTSTGSWGAIGSDRPSSRQKTRRSVDSLSNASDNESPANSFASLLKSANRTPTAEANGRKAPMLVLTSAEKRKTPIPA